MPSLERRPGHRPGRGCSRDGDGLGDAFLDAPRCRGAADDRPRTRRPIGLQGSSRYTLPLAALIMIGGSSATDTAGGGCSSGSRPVAAARALRLAQTPPDDPARAAPGHRRGSADRQLGVIRLFRRTTARRRSGVVVALGCGRARLPFLGGALIDLAAGGWFLINVQRQSGRRMDGRHVAGEPDTGPHAASTYWCGAGAVAWARSPKPSSPQASAGGTDVVVAAVAGGHGVLLVVRERRPLPHAPAAACSPPEVTGAKRHPAVTWLGAARVRRARWQGSARLRRHAAARDAANIMRSRLSRARRLHGDRARLP